MTTANTTLKFGINTSTNYIHFNLQLTLLFPEYKYECILPAVDANDQPFLWQWCETTMSSMTHCNNSKNEDYALIITNPTNVAVPVYGISIQTTQLKNDIVYSTNSSQEINSFDGNDNIMVNGSVSIDLHNIANNVAQDITVLDTETEHCPYSNSQNSKFIYVMIPKNWNDAQSYCENVYESNLATIITNDDIKEVLGVMRQATNIYKMWIGMTDIKIEGEWGWIDGTQCGYVNGTGQCKDDPHWAPNEPNDLAREHCAQFVDHYGGVFNDYDCFEEFTFTCNVNENMTNNDVIFIGVNNSRNIVSNNDDIVTTDGTKLKDAPSMVWIILMIAFALLGCILIWLICSCYWSKKKLNKMEVKLDEVKAENQRLNNEVAELSTAVYWSKTHLNSTEQNINGNPTPPPTPPVVNELGEGDETQGVLSLSTN